MFPSWTNKINTFIQSTGTYNLIISLTRIILTLLIPENVSLRIIGSFFGLASTLLVIISGFFRGNKITKMYNMKIFLTMKKKKNYI